MTTATVLQLARFNSTNTPSNSEWVTNLKEPVILNQGDSITVKQSYIDSRLNSSGNIVIEQPIDLSLIFYFYLMFPCDGGSTQQDPKTGSISRNVGGSIEDAPFGYADTAIVAPIDYCNFLGTLQQTEPILPLFQGIVNDYQNNNGIPKQPFQNNGIPPIINQSQAMEVPMLLVESYLRAPNNISNRPITRQWKYTLPAGSYSPLELADLLTKSMSSIQPRKTQPSFSPFQQFGQEETSPAQATDLNEFLIRGTITSVTNIFNANSQKTSDHFFAYPYLQDSPINPMYGQMGFVSNSPEFADTTSPLVGTFANFCSDIRFNPVYFDPIIGPSLILESEKTNPLTVLPSHFAGEYSFTLNQKSDDGVAWDITQACVIHYETPLVGASEISLEYNQEAGVFQFTYLHTPILQLPTTDTSTGATTGGQPVEVVKIIKSINLNQYDANISTVPEGEVKISEASRHSGVFFQSMTASVAGEPIDFWKGIMGFDVPNITFPANYVWGADRKMTFEQFNKITTSGYIGIQNNFNFTNSSNTSAIPNTNAPSYTSAYPLLAGSVQGELSYSNLLNCSRWYVEHSIASGLLAPSIPTPAFDYQIFLNKNYYEEYSSALVTTNPLQAIQAPLSQISSTGHYLISIDEYKNTKNDFVNENDFYNIKAIVSNYYLSQGAFCTQPFQDSAIYVHNSPIPKTINTFRVRLIEPSTMKNASNIGPNSSVYLQINKIVSDISVLQTV